MCIYSDLILNCFSKFGQIHTLHGYSGAFSDFHIVSHCAPPPPQGANLGLQAVELNQSVFYYRTPDFVNGPFVALDHIFDLAPSDRFLNFSFPSYGVSPSGLRPKNLHFLRYTHITPIFWGQTDPTQWDLKSPIS